MAIKFLSTVAVDTNVLYVDAAANKVGIGTTSPQSKLHIDLGTVDVKAQLDAIGGFDGMLVDGTNASYNLIGGNGDKYSLGALNDGSFRIYNEGGAGYALTLNNSGSLGIGTTSPSEKLEVAGSVKTTGTVKFYNSTSHYGSIYANSEGLNLDTVANRHMIFKKASVEVMRISTTGNVGIGTTSPSMKLEVSTDARMVAKFTGNTDDGTGYVGAVVEIESNNDARGRGVYLTHRNSADTGPSEWYAGVPYTGVGYSIGNAAYGTSVNSNTGPAHKDQSKLFITETGNVGIGTTNPSTKLHVAGIAQVTESGNSAFYGGNYLRVFNDQVYTMRNSGGNQRFAFDNTSGSLSTYNSSNVRTTYFNNSGSSYINGGNVGIGTTSPIAKLTINSTSGDNAGGLSLYDGSGTAFYMYQFADNKFVLEAGNGLKNLVLDNAGNVGIGTASPTQLLDVAGADAEIVINDSNDAPALRFRGSGVTSAMIEVNSAKDMFFKTGGVAEQMRITSAGNVGIGTTSPIGMLSVVNPAANTNTWTPTNNPDLWVSNAGTSNSYYPFGVTTNSGDIFSITNAGNVGIGTTSPSRKLHVHADSGNAYLQLTQATTGTTSNDGFQISMGASQVNLINRENGSMVFETNNTEKMRITSAGDTGIGVTTPRAKLDVAGGVKVANDTDTASANKEGTLRYRLAPSSPKSQSMVDMCMKTGPSSYAWVNIVTNTWNN